MLRAPRGLKQLLLLYAAQHSSAGNTRGATQKMLPTSLGRRARVIGAPVRRHAPAHTHPFSFLSTCRSCICLC